MGLNDTHRIQTFNRMFFFVFFWLSKSFIYYAKYLAHNCRDYLPFFIHVQKCI